MPKRPRRNKQTIRSGAAPRSIGDLLSTRLPALAERALSGSEESEWQVAIRAALGPELNGKVTRIMLNCGRITVNAESSVWAARLKFALAELAPSLERWVPGYRDFVVRVRPGTAANGKP